MSQSSSTQALDTSPEGVYRALLRCLKRTKGFGIVFVQCSPSVGTRLINRVRGDLFEKKIEILELTEPINNLYDIIANWDDRNDLNILFIQGVEKSLEPYIKPGYGGDGDYYNLDTVPPILSHLNQRREIFRDRLSKICFVFILPLFGVKYFIRRAGDFFDWSSGVFKFPTETEELDKELHNILREGSYKECCKLTPTKQIQKLIKVEALIKEVNDNAEIKSGLFIQQGNLLTSVTEYEAAVSSYQQAIQLKPAHYIAWHNLGNALDKLGRHEEAVYSYNHAITIKPDFQEAWYNRGDALVELGKDEEANAIYEKTIFDSEFKKVILSSNSLIVQMIRLSNIFLLESQSIWGTIHKNNKFLYLDIDEVLNELYIQGYNEIQSGQILIDIHAWAIKKSATIIRRLLQNQYQYSRRNVMIDIDGVMDYLAYTTYDDPYENIFLEESIEEFIQELKPIDQTIIRLRFFEGLSQIAIAKELAKDGGIEVSQVTVSRRLHGAIAFLRRRIANKLGYL
jgi:RNA polymerase sigma factor (sigma-70 family)